jgi:hypothetical protein
VRFQDRVRESNTITNLDTGETLQEGPDSFLQRVLFNDDGTVTIEGNGLSVLVTDGENRVVDAGRVVLLGTWRGLCALGVVGRHCARTRLAGVGAVRVGCGWGDSGAPGQTQDRQLRRGLRR